MFSLTGRDGRKIAFLQVFLPCLMGFLALFGPFGQILYLQVCRPRTPDPAHGYVEGLTINEVSHYMSSADLWREAWL